MYTREKECLTQSLIYDELGIYRGRIQKIFGFYGDINKFDVCPRVGFAEGKK